VFLVVDILENTKEKKLDQWLPQVEGWVEGECKWGTQHNLGDAEILLCGSVVEET
jgi:hypothetical protein